MLIREQLFDMMSAHKKCPNIILYGGKMKLNLIDSQPASRPSDFTRLFQSPANEIETYTLQEIGEMTAGLVDAFTQDGIAGFEKNAAIIKIYEDLQKAPNPQARLRLSIALKNAKAKEYIERNQFMSMIHDIQGVAGAMAVFAPPELANQIQVISNHFVNVGVQVAGIAGYGPLAAEGAVTPLGFGTTLLTAIGQISSLFGRPRGITIERATFDAICMLSRQVDQLREEMHRRFDEVQFQIFLMNSDIMIQFGLVHKNVELVHTKLEQIHAEIVANHSQLQSTLNSINQAVTDLGRQFLEKETREVVNKLVDVVNPILYNINNGYMTDSEFTTLSGKLLAAIHSTIHQREIAGPLVNLTDRIVTKWQSPKDSAQWATYQINPLLAYATTTLGRPLEREVGNPLLLCYLTIALLLINTREYSTSSDRLALHISKNSLEAIKKVVGEFEEIKKVLEFFRDPMLYTKLLKQIRININTLKKEYLKSVAEFEISKAAELENTVEKAKTKQQEQDIKQFNSQKIEPNWKGGDKRYEWFRAEHQVSDGSYSNTCVPSLNQGMGENTAGKSLSARNAYVSRMEEEFQANIRKFENLSASIIYPAEGSKGKLLPITPDLMKNILNTLPQNIQHAVELNQLQLRFQYIIEDKVIEVKKEKGFNWLFQEPKKEKATPKFSLQLWIENNLCYSVCLPYVMQIYTPGESEWLFWVGGTRPIGGVNCVNFGSGSHKHCSWNQQIYIPRTEYCEGYIKTFDPHAVINTAPPANIIQVNELAKQRITKCYQTFREQFNKNIRADMKSDDDSELGKSITAMDANFKRLKALLALAFPDIHSPSHVLYRVNQADAPVSRSDLVSYLENNPSLLGQEVFVILEGFVNELEKNLPATVSSLTLTASNQMLDRVLMELQDWIKLYSPTAVESNSLDPIPRGRERHDQLRQQARTITSYEAILTALSRTVIGLPPDAAQAFIEETREHLSEVAAENPRILDDGADASPNLVSRMIADGRSLFRRNPDSPNPALPPHLLKVLTNIL